MYLLMVSFSPHIVTLTPPETGLPLESVTLNGIETISPSIKVTSSTSTEGVSLSSDNTSD